MLFGGDVDPGARGLGSKLSTAASKAKKRLIQYFLEGYVQVQLLAGDNLFLD